MNFEIISDKSIVLKLNHFIHGIKSQWVQEFVFEPSDIDMNFKKDL